MVFESLHTAFRDFAKQTCWQNSRIRSIALYRNRQYTFHTHWTQTYHGIHTYYQNIISHPFHPTIILFTCKCNEHFRTFPNNCLFKNSPLARSLKVSFLSTSSLEHDRCNLVFSEYIAAHCPFLVGKVWNFLFAKPVDFFSHRSRWLQHARSFARFFPFPFLLADYLPPLGPCRELKHPVALNDNSSGKSLLLPPWCFGAKIIFHPPKRENRAKKQESFLWHQIQ